MEHNSFLDLQNDIVAGAALVIAKFMIKADLKHFASFKQCNGLIRPECTDLAIWSAVLVGRVDLHADFNIFCR